MTQAARWNRLYALAVVLVCLAVVTAIAWNTAANGRPHQRTAPAPNVPLRAPQAAVPQD
jgi:hypothetical protein